MKIVVFGDVHGNLVALEKLFKIEKSETDLFISHGDIVNYGPWTNECVSFLETVPNIKLLTGNHEHYFINGSYDGKNEVAKSFFDFCYLNFDSKLISILEKYEKNIVIPDYTIQHTIGDQYIFSDTNLEDMIFDTNYIIGHSHQQFYKNIGKNSLYNTGSLGQNRQYINQSCYIKYDTNTKKITLKSFINEIDKVINQMKSDKYPKICLDYYLNKQQIIL